MTRDLRWGVIGTGAIAHKFVEQLAESRTGTCVAVGSRTREAADLFASRFGIENRYSGYEALLSADVDVVYIAIPHSSHSEWAVRAMEAGKNVLSEKPLGLTAQNAKLAIDAARQHGVFLMEGYMHRCHPQIEEVARLVAAGAIGEPRMIRATFGYATPFDSSSRLFDPRLGGGAILDVGGYPVSFSRRIAGALVGDLFADPIGVSGTGRVLHNGVDELAVGSLRFENGVVAQIGVAVCSNLDNTASIYGSEGSLTVLSPWLAGTRRPDGPNEAHLLLETADGTREIHVPSDRPIYALEADHVAECISSGRVQSPLVSWDDTIGNMQTMDRWRDTLSVERSIQGAGLAIGLP